MLEWIQCHDNGVSPLSGHKCIVLHVDVNGAEGVDGGRGHSDERVGSDGDIVDPEGAFEPVLKRRDLKVRILRLAKHASRNRASTALPAAKIRIRTLFASQKIIVSRSRMKCHGTYKKLTEKAQSSTRAPLLEIASAVRNISGATDVGSAERSVIFHSCADACALRPARHALHGVAIARFDAAVYASSSAIEEGGVLKC